MDFELSGSERAFRDEVRAWLKANAPSDRDGDGDLKAFIDRRREWQRKLHEAGYVAVTKAFQEGRPLTTYSLTREGRKAFAGYIDLLEQIVQQTKQK